MQKIFWKGISHDTRIKAISEITAVIARHGTILNFQKFSDVILSLVIEIESGRLKSLHNCLSQIVLLEGNDNCNSISPNDTCLFLQVTFTQGTGDLEIEVPRTE